MKSLGLLSLIFLTMASVRTLASDRVFPEELLGYWSDSKETCTTIVDHGPAYVKSGSLWLRLVGSEVMGTTQARFFEIAEPQMLDMSPAKYSVLVQTLESHGSGPRLVDLTLSLDGDLFETIVGSRASQVYVKCY